ncbi:MAG: polysaccharide lyase 6 family protein [Bacteroidales bacterium]|nr:polysaccharide lyase 6 family protein [Bacteroidales bacterium]
MIRKAILSAAIAALMCSCAGGPMLPSQVETALLTAKDGDTLVIANGTYADQKLSWKGTGAKVVILPQDKGGVVFTGESSLKLSGRGLEVNSLVWKGCPCSKGAVVEFKDGDSLAFDTRLSECVIDECNPSRRDVISSYVSLYGKGNRVDHCSFLGKKSLGVTLLVMLNYTDCLDNHHEIDHNHFGPRPVYGSNGAETIRIGTSQQCMENSRAWLHDNLFDRCNGEVEVVSIKSSENVIENNRFWECQGVLALRHGDRNVAKGNVFVGNGVRNTGGIRIVGEDQQLLGNRFYGVVGTRFFSPLALMCGVPNSLPNRYMQVKRTILKDNEFYACSPADMLCGQDFERTLPPVETVFENHKVSSEQGDVPSYDSLKEGMGVDWYVKDEIAKEKKTIVISAADTVFEKAIVVDCPTQIVAAPGVKPVVRFAGSKGDNMITIRDGGSLLVRGITFDGVLTPGKALAKGGICTDVDMVEPYTLTVEDCTFRNFGESGFIPVRGLKGTFADTVVVRSCRFEALSGDAISFAAESDDKGRYNADDMFIENCHFERILGIPVNIYRGGSDESTAGPYVHVRDCKFVASCNKVRGSCIRITGAQVLDITGCSFDDSGRGGYAIRLDDAPWEVLNVSGNTFVSSGKILSNRKL